MKQRKLFELVRRAIVFNKFVKNVRIMELRLLMS